MADAVSTRFKNTDKAHLLRNIIENTLNPTEQKEVTLYTHNLVKIAEFLKPSF